MTSSRLTRLRRTVLMAGIVGTPLIFSTRFLDPFNSPKMAFLIAVTSLAGGLWLVGASFGETRVFPGRYLLIPAAAVLVPLVVSWLAGAYPEWSRFGQYGRFQGLVPYLVVVCFGLLVADSFKGDPLSLVWSLALSGAAVGTYVFLQMLGLDPVTWPPTTDPYTASTLGNPNFTGGFLAITLPLCLHLWWQAPRWRLAGAGATIFVSLGLIFSFSQGAWAAAAAGIALQAGLSFDPRRVALRRLLIGAAILIAVALPLTVVAVAAGADLGRLNGTALVRGYLWEAAIEMSADAPIVGRGPNVYAIEGTRYAPAGATVVPFETPDDPHSVLFSFLANAGIVGALGFLSLLAWFMRQATRAMENGRVAVAFIAAGAVYFAQSLVSIDELSLRVALWTVLAGCVISIARSTNEEQEHRATSPLPLRLAALTSALIVAGGGLYFSGRWVFAELNIRRGLDGFATGETTEGQRGFDRALQLRDDPSYRLAYTQVLGSAALAEGAEGADLIEKSRKINAYLQDLPIPIAMFTQAQSLHHWGHFDPGADHEALALFDKGLALDPFNILALIESSEVLIDLDRSIDAVARLERIEDVFTTHTAQYWGMLSIARTQAGDLAGAELALDQGLASRAADCRVLVAQEMLRSSVETYVPDNAVLLRLRFSCDRGLYDFMVDHLPARTRMYY